MPRQPIRVYADTSVYGGALDEEFAEVSRRFFEQVRQGRFTLVVSPLVEDELARAPEPVRRLYEELRIESEPALITTEALQLRAAYLAAGIVTAAYADDALHVAVATVAGCSVIVSWNFRHHVHFRRIPLYNAVNRINGHGELGIHTPSEVVDYEGEEKDL